MYRAIDQFEAVRSTRIRSRKEQNSPMNNLSDTLILFITNRFGVAGKRPDLASNRNKLTAHEKKTFRSRLIRIHLLGIPRIHVTLQQVHLSSWRWLVRQPRRWLLLYPRTFRAYGAIPSNRLPEKRSSRWIINIRVEKRKENQL